MLMIPGKSYSQKEEKRASPTITIKQVINGGATITITYGQPSVKGRTIGKDLEPKEGEIWRAGANEATVFESDKAIAVNGKKLDAGKYAFFIISNSGNWTLVFNKVWKTWGAYEYEKNKAQDALQITVPEATGSPASEKLTYSITKEGLVTISWGDKKAAFTVTAVRPIPKVR